MYIITKITIYIYIPQKVLICWLAGFFFNFVHVITNVLCVQLWDTIHEHIQYDHFPLSPCPDLDRSNV